MVSVWAVAVFCARSVRAENDVAGTLIVLNDNGAWCWYQDERAVIHNGRLVVGSVANAAGAGGASRGGNIELTTYNFATGGLTRFVLHPNLQGDDHNAPALLVRSDGRYLAVYARHGSDQLSRWRISVDPNDTITWQPEQTFNNGAGTTYSNVHRLSAENDGAGRLYNLARTVGLDPNLLISDDEGQSWAYGGRLLDWPTPAGDPKFTGTDGSRPYLRYASNGRDEIHFITSEDHPRAYDNSIYHGVIRGGRVYDSFGGVIDDSVFDGSARRPNEYTVVFDTDASPLGFAWTTDLRLDAQSRPYALFTARANNTNSNDHRFLYARFDGAAWHVHEIAKAGGFLYPSENDYTGLGALDPRDPNTLYISTRIDPRNGSTTGRYEIYKGVTGDGGAQWTWTAITWNSGVDNLRPMVPPSDGPQTALLWFRGTYSTFTNYNTQVVALPEPPPACVSVPAVTVEEPIPPGATAVTVSGIDAQAAQVNVYRSGGAMIGSALGNPPDTPPTMTISVSPLLRGDLVSARQVIDGQESCAPAAEVQVWSPLRILYVDADANTNGSDGNTTISGAPVNTGAGGNATTSGSAGPAGDGKWHVRSRDTVNGGEVWEAGSAEAPPPLITTLTLAPGTYDLYGLFWNNAGNAGVWDIQFRLGPSGPFSTFDRSNAILTGPDGGDFVHPVATRDDAGNFQVLLIAPLGRFELAGPIDVHVNPVNSSTGGDERTWYDGIGYAPVCNRPFADADADGDVDHNDFAALQRCFSGPAGGIPAGCACFDRGIPDGDVDTADLDAFVRCISGPNLPWSQLLAIDCVP